MAEKIKLELMNMGVTQKAILFNTEGKILALLRGETAPSYPLHWDLPGGVLEYGEDPIKGIIREIQEECGLSVTDVLPFDVYGHNNSEGFWVTIAYRCKTVSDVVTISSEHTGFKWVTKEEFLKLPAAPKIIQFVKNYPL